MKRVFLLSVLVACHRAPKPSVADAVAVEDASVDVASAPAPTPPKVTRVLPDVKTDWCLEGWRGLDEATCYVLPDDDAGAEDPDELLIYLAGIVPPAPRSTPKEHVQRVVGNVARHARIAALLPRGRTGIGPKDAKDWWAWPTSGADYAKYGPTLMAEWKAERKALEDALGHQFRRVYLAGSSSGAYFLTFIAFAGAMEFDGFAAASGGSVGPGLAPTAPKRPFYVGWGEGDPTNDGPKALAQYLKSQHWPTRSAAHQTGHGAREIYLEEALAFWREQ